MRVHIANWVLTAALAAGAPLVPACQPSSEDITELRNQQRQILAKLDRIEKKLAQGPGRQQQVGPDPAKAYDLPVGKSPLKGPENAPVTIVEFSDYQCPFCARSEPLINDVLKEYPTQVRLVYKHFPLTAIHPNAMGAAQAAAAAQKQGKFWQMHELLFANQRALQPEQLKSYAQQVGLDVAKFEADMASPEVKSAIQEDMQLAQKVGIRGTPTIFVNGKIVQNRSLEGFKQLIEPLLKQQAKR